MANIFFYLLQMLTDERLISVLLIIAIILSTYREQNSIMLILSFLTDDPVSV